MPGGPGRNRTDVRGFAGPCITTLPPGRRRAIARRDRREPEITDGLLGGQARTATRRAAQGVSCAIVLPALGTYKTG
jgi:hypothetical protein